jgi:hypothetical protein
MMSSVGVDRVLTMDLHSEQIQGFFDIPVDNIYSGPIMLGDIWKHDYKQLVVVSPDVGGVVRARALAKRLEADLAIIDKRRPRPNVATVMNIIGEVAGRTCVIVEHAVRSRRRAEKTRRREGFCLLHARSAVGVCGGTDCRIGNRRNCRHRYHSADGSGAQVREDPCADGVRAGGGDDAPHQRRGFGELPVRGVAGFAPKQLGRTLAGRRHKLNGAQSARAHQKARADEYVGSMK